MRAVLHCFIVLLLWLPFSLAHKHIEHGHHGIRGVNHRDDGSVDDGEISATQQNNDMDFDFQEPTMEERLMLDKAHHTWMMKHGSGGRNLASTVISVSVSVTVVVNSTTDKVPSNGWLDDVILARALSALNKGFRNSPFQFKLLQMRHVYDLDFFDGNPAYEKEFKTKYRIAQPHVLNLYYCRTVGRNPQLLGYTYPPVRMDAFPEGDGVVFINPAIQEWTMPSLIHQVGHWLGLLDTWTDGCSPQLTHKHSYNGVNYFYLVGDGVLDTPSHSGSTWSVVDGRAGCWRDVVLDTCNATLEASNYLIDPGFDPVNNYMNEAPARCYSAHGYFTPGQVTRMIAIWDHWRKPVTFAPTQAPTTVAKTCREKNKSCRKTSQCCGKLQCVFLPSRGIKGTCLRCKRASKQCEAGSQCCSGRCTNNLCEA